MDMIISFVFKCPQSYHTESEILGTQFVMFLSQHAREFYLYVHLGVHIGSRLNLAGFAIGLCLVS